MFFKTTIRMFMFNTERTVFSMKFLILLLLYSSFGLTAYHVLPSQYLLKDIGSFISMLVPVTALFLGITIFSEDIEENTLLYLFTKPLSKAGILTGKYLSFIAVCSVMMIISFIGVAAAVFIHEGSFELSHFKNVDLLLSALFLSLCAYGSIFVFISLVLKRPLMYGFGFLFGWEQLISRIPADISHLTVKFYLASFTRDIFKHHFFAPSFVMKTIEFPSLFYSACILVAVSIVFIVSSFLIFSRKEYTFIVDSY